MDNNDKLFEYAYEAMAENGGDGHVLVVLKQQVVANVTKEFMAWQDKKCQHGPFMRLIESRDGVFSSDQESIHFKQWENYKEYLTHATKTTDDSPPCPLTATDAICAITHPFVDTVIITW
jgi:hypothetical protein